MLFCHVSVTVEILQLKIQNQMQAQQSGAGAVKAWDPDIGIPQIPGGDKDVPESFQTLTLGTIWPVFKPVQVPLHKWFNMFYK